MAGQIDGDALGDELADDGPLDAIFGCRSAQRLDLADAQPFGLDRRFPCGGQGLFVYHTGILAPEIPDSEGGTKSEEPRKASVPDLLVTKAKQTGATVTFIEDGSLLESIGGVGAFLRWRE